MALQHTTDEKTAGDNVHNDGNSIHQKDSKDCDTVDLRILRDDESAYKGSDKQSEGKRKETVVRISITEEGPLGVKVEKSAERDGAAAVTLVVPKSPAARADMCAGDVICHVDNGQPMKYEKFVKAAASSQRPLVFAVERQESPSSLQKQRKALWQRNPTKANALARQRAAQAALARQEDSRKASVVAAAAATRRKEADNDHNNGPTPEPTRQAVVRAKAEERSSTAAMGFNPYGTAQVSSRQMPRTPLPNNYPTGTDAAAVAASLVNGIPGEWVFIPDEVPSSEFQSTHPSTASTLLPRVLDDALEHLVTANDVTPLLLCQSLSLIQKLVVNATQKSIMNHDNNSDDDKNGKYRRVRLSQAQIQNAIVSVEGALDVLLAFGFFMAELDGETYLVYQNEQDDNNGHGFEEWLPQALERLDSYIQKCRRTN